MLFISLGNGNGGDGGKYWGGCSSHSPDGSVTPASGTQVWQPLDRMAPNPRLASMMPFFSTDISCPFPANCRFDRGRIWTSAVLQRGISIFGRFGLDYSAFSADLSRIPICVRPCYGRGQLGKMSFPDITSSSAAGPRRFWQIPDR